MLGGGYPRRNSCIRINISRWGGTNVAWAKATGGRREGVVEGRPCKTAPAAGNSNSLCSVLINQSRGVVSRRDEKCVQGGTQSKLLKAFSRRLRAAMMLFLMMIMMIVTRLVMVMVVIMVTARSSRGRNDDNGSAAADTARGFHHTRIYIYVYTIHCNNITVVYSRVSISRTRKHTHTHTHTHSHKITQ